MRNEVVPGSRSRWRVFALTCIAAVGLVTIVASGGSAEAPQCSFFSNVCNPTLGPGAFPPLAAASVFPQKLTVQVGGTATLAVETSGIDSPTFQWRRSSDGGRSYVDIAGATAATYTLAGVQLTDDATVFRVDVQGSGGAATYAVSQLAVSSMPGVVLQDGDFQLTDWLVTESASPAQSKPLHTEERATTGGHPDAFRRMVHTMPVGPSTLNVLHVSQSASYDPPSQGAIYVIDYVEDCIVTSNSTSTYLVDSNLLMEQAGRRYAAVGLTYCQSPGWSALPPRLSFGAKDFVLIDGPACSAGESCPDFSGSAKPLRFGFVRHSQAAAGVAGVIAHGIDNWKVTVWRR
jgi:hypothetical protein